MCVSAHFLGVFSDVFSASFCTDFDICNITKWHKPVIIPALLVQLGKTFNLCVARLGGTGRLAGHRLPAEAIRRYIRMFRPVLSS